MCTGSYERLTCSRFDSSLGLINIFLGLIKASVANSLLILDIIVIL